MTKTKKKTVNVLAQLEQQEAMERTAARGRYWHAVDKLTQGEDTSLSPDEATELREDLRTLGLTTGELQRDVGALREVRRLAEVDGDDSEARAAERHADAKEHARKADAQVEKAKKALRVAEEEARNATWAMNSASSAIEQAKTRERTRRQRLTTSRGDLLGRGAPARILPPLPESPRKPTIRHRVLQRTFIDNILREPGDVVLLAERVTTGDVLRVMADDEPDVVVPKWRVQALLPHHDEDRLSRGEGQVWITEHDPSSNPYVKVVGDDVPLGLGRLPAPME